MLSQHRKGDGDKEGSWYFSNETPTPASHLRKRHPPYIWGEEQANNLMSLVLPLPRGQLCVPLPVPIWLRCSASSDPLSVRRRGLGSNSNVTSASPLHERHANLGKGVPRERHNKSYTREHGGVEWGGMRATGGGGVQDTHEHNIGTSVLYRCATIYHVTPLMGRHVCMEK